MTSKDIQTKYEQELALLLEELQALTAMIKKPDHQKLTYKQLHKFFDKKIFAVDLFPGDSLEQIKESIKEFESETKAFKKKLYFRSAFNAEGSGYEDDNSIDFSRMEAEYYEPKDPSSPVFKSYAMETTKSLVTQEIKKHRKLSDSTHFYIDCKIVSLFREDKIDFDTLCNITLANCKI